MFFLSCFQQGSHIAASNVKGIVIFHHLEMFVYGIACKTSMASCHLVFTQQSYFLLVCLSLLVCIELIAILIPANDWCYYNLCLYKRILRKVCTLSLVIRCVQMRECDFTQILIGYVSSDVPFDWLEGNTSMYEENLFRLRSK